MRNFHLMAAGISAAMLAPNTESGGAQDEAAAAKAEKERLAAEKKAEKEAKAAQAKAEREAKAAAAKAEKEAKKAQAKAEREAKAAAAKAEKAEKAAAAKAEKEASRMPEQNGVRRPKADTLCGRAWAIFDSVSAKNGSPASIGESMELARAQSLNEANVRAEYARWRKFHGITGRVAAPKTETPAA